MTRPSPGDFLLFACLAVAGCCGPNVERTAAYADAQAAQNDRLGVAATTTEARALARSNALWWRQVRPALIEGAALEGAPK